ncbi:MAG: hypothetical protein HFI03_02520 [Lachnospiraceae bacterium]|jgi:hypothetical protein|nr:hypothetical protein [Lachnospiraceae bacterium]
MKKNAGKMLALLLTGFLVLNGCGESDQTQEAEETEETSEENTGENTEETTSGETTEDNATDAATDETTEGNPDDAAPEETAENTTAATAQGASGTDNTEAAAESGTPNVDTSSPGSSASAADIPAPNVLAAARPTTEELLAGERKTLVGIIIDATKYSVSIQTPEGISYYMTIPETGVSGNLDYITIGQIATFTYVGTLDETALLVGISDSGMVTGIYVEEYAFAIKIINAVKSMDMKALSDLTNFPVFLDTGNYDGPINTSGEFEVIDSEKIFSEALVERIINYNLFDLKYTDAGFVLGGNGTPNITFDIDDEGILGIIGINSAPANNSTK